MLDDSSIIDIQVIRGKRGELRCCCCAVQDVGQSDTGTRF